MPLVVSSLTGDASDVFNWTCSVSPGGTQDLSELLQMLREHYCVSFTFWEQRNMVKNLCQGACEDATGFMIRVGSSISNLAKDWKGQLTEAELQSLQYEGLYIPSFLEEALGGDGNLQIKMAHTMQAQERHDKKCFICQSGDHLTKDHYKEKNGTGPLQPKGPLQNKSAWKMAKASLPG